MKVEVRNLFVDVRKVAVVILCMLVSVSLFAQESEKKEKIRYSNITEFGLFATSPHSFGLDLTTVHGVSINKQHHIGLGFGIGGGFHESYDGYYYSPVFVNYRLYFKPEKKFSPHINVSLGGMVATDNIVGVYSSIAAGFKAGAFSFSSGLSFMPFHVERQKMMYNGGYYGQRVNLNKWYYPFGLTLKLGFVF